MLRSVNNALDLLEAFSLEAPGRGVTELSHTLGLGKSTVHRLLATLAARGYVAQDARTGQYRLGFKAFEVGSIVVGQRSVRETAAPFLQSLMRATGETVHLGVLDGWDVVYIDKVESQQAIQTQSRIGRRAPTHCTALGKALLACLPEDDLARFLRRQLKAHAPRTLTDPGALRSDLAQAKARRYAVDNEEFAQGIRCIAVAIRDHAGEVVAALGITGTAVRISRQRIPLLARLVVETGEAISRGLGFRSDRARAATAARGHPASRS